MSRRGIASVVPSSSICHQKWSDAQQSPFRPSSRTVSTAAAAVSSGASKTLVSRATRCFSSPATAATSTAASAGAAATSGAAASGGSSNVFLDHIGSFFLAGIGMIVVSLVRSYKGSTNRNLTRERLEQQSGLDPLEIDDLRLANAELTLDVYREIFRDLQREFTNQDEVLYEDFVRSVRSSMARMKGEEFTIELGHLIDRIVLDALSKRNQTTTEHPQPLAFWMTALCLALNAPVPERTLALFEVLKATSASRGGSEQEDEKVTIANIRSMVDYLQETCQLTPDSQVVPIEERKYPVQQYDRGHVGRLFEWNGAEDEAVDIDAFASILKSRAVCVWGECYHKRKSV